MTGGIEPPRPGAVNARFRPGLASLLAAALLALLGSAGGLSAQRVQGTLLDAETEAGIGGAIVVLLDERGEQRTGTLSDDAGRFSLQAPSPGRYVLRAERIGYRTTASATLEIPPAGLSGYVMYAVAEAGGLREITVRAGRRQCRIRPEDGAELQRVWDEARKALEAARLGEQQRWVRYEVEHYHRTLDPTSLRVRTERRDTARGRATNPFQSVGVERLLEHGYIHVVGDSTAYYAPDAEVLLSDAFLDSRCFRLQEGRGETEGLLGLAFEPARRGRVPDVTGTLWVDRASAELRRLEYRYTQLPSGIPTHRLGGLVEFRRLPNGAWIVDRWWIRAPELHALGSDRVQMRTLPGQRAERNLLQSVLERGGEVLSFETADGVFRSSARTQLRGVVFDSVRARPLDGASVFLHGTRYSATTDSTGTYELVDLPEGEYLLAFTHPYWEAFGVEALPRELSIQRGVAATVDLAIPGAAAVQSLVCQTGENYRGLSMVAGFVRDAASGEVLPGAEVRLSVGGAPAGAGSAAGETADEGAVAVADRAGFYRLCGVPVGRPFAVEATFEGRSSGSFLLDLDATTVVRYDLPISRR